MARDILKKPFKNPQSYSFRNLYKRDGPRLVTSLALPLSLPESHFSASLHSEVTIREQQGRSKTGQESAMALIRASYVCGIIVDGAILLSSIM